MRKRKNNKLILFIILGVIVLCGIGIGVYFVIDNNKKIPDKAGFALSGTIIAVVPPLFIMFL